MIKLKQVGYPHTCRNYALETGTKTSENSPPPPPPPRKLEREKKMQPSTLTLMNMTC